MTPLVVVYESLGNGWMWHRYERGDRVGQSSEGFPNRGEARADAEDCNSDAKIIWQWESWPKECR